MVYFILALIVIAGFLLKAGYLSIPLENNGAVFLYNVRFGKNEFTNHGQWAFVGLLEWLFRIFHRNGSADYTWLRVAGVLMNSAATVLVFFIAKACWACDEAGLFSAGIFSLFTSVPHLIPWFTNAERLSSVFVAAGFFLLCTAILNTGKNVLPCEVFFAASGFMYGMAFLSKIPSLAEFAVTGVTFLVLTGNIRAGLIIIAGFILPVIVHIAIVIARKRLGEYTGLFTTVVKYKSADVNVERNTKPSARNTHPALSFFADIFSGTSVLWILGFTAAFTVIAWNLFFYDSLARETGSFVAGLLSVSWLCGALLGIAVQQVWTPGHWTSIMAPLSVLAGNVIMNMLTARKIPFSYIPSDFSHILVAMVFLFGAAVAVITSRGHSWGAASMKPFQEGYRRVGRYINSITAEKDHIFSWSWHPQVYLLAGRPSAGNAYMFYCSVSYLDGILTDWRRVLLKGFMINRPSVVFIDAKDFPFSMVSAVIGAKFTLDMRAFNELHTYIYKVTYPADALSTGEKTADTALEERLSGLLAAAEKEIAESRGHIAYTVLFAIRKVSSEQKKIDALLDSLNPGWKLVPHEHEILPDIPCKVGAFDSPDGGRYVMVEEDGKNIFLNSRYAPVKEAERFGESITGTDYDAVFVFGSGAGYNVKTILAKMSAATQIIVIERRRQIYEAMKTVNDFSAEMKSGRLKVFVSAAPSGFESIFKLVAGAQGFSRSRTPGGKPVLNILISFGTLSQQLDAQYYEQARQAVLKHYKL